MRWSTSDELIKAKSMGERKKQQTKKKKLTSDGKRD